MITPKPLLRPVIRITVDKVDIVAWNYETGRDEPNPYPKGSPGLRTPGPGAPIVTVPIWASKFRAEYIEWEKCEALAVHFTSSRELQSPMLAEAYREGALNSWVALESKMLWSEAVKVAEFRRKYIEWLADERDKKPTFDPVTEAGLPMLERIVAAGFRTLAMKAHPDMGGTSEEFHQLKTAKKQLDFLVGEMKDML